RNARGEPIFVAGSGNGSSNSRQSFDGDPNAGLPPHFAAAECDPTAASRSGEPAAFFGGVRNCGCGGSTAGCRDFDTPKRRGGTAFAGTAGEERRPGGAAVKSPSLLGASRDTSGSHFTNVSPGLLSWGYWQPTESFVAKRGS